VAKHFLDDCLLVSQYADEINKTPKTVYDWIDKGLPVFDAFGRTMIHIPTANAWYEARLRSKNKRQRTAA